MYYSFRNHKTCIATSAGTGKLYTITDLRAWSSLYGDLLEKKIMGPNLGCWFIAGGIACFLKNSLVQDQIWQVLFMRKKNVIWCGPSHYKACMQGHKTLTWGQKTHKINRKQTSHRAGEGGMASVKESTERRIFELELLSHGPWTVLVEKENTINNWNPYKLKAKQRKSDIYCEHKKVVSNK